MRELDFGQIIVLIIFILVPVVKFVVQRIRRRFEDQIPQQESVTQIRRQAQPVATPPPLTRAAIDPVGESQAPTAFTRRSTSHFTKRSLLGAKGDMQRGIVIMTVLGPCRAFNPAG